MQVKWQKLWDPVLLCFMVLTACLTTVPVAPKGVFSSRKLSEPHAPKLSVGMFLPLSGSHKDLGELTSSGKRTKSKIPKKTTDLSWLQMPPILSCVV